MPAQASLAGAHSVATGMGFEQGANEANDIVFCNSSRARLLGGEPLMGFLAPVETERLVRDKAMLPAGTTERVVSKGPSPRPAGRW